MKCVGIWNPHKSLRQLLGEDKKKDIKNQKVPRALQGSASASGRSRFVPYTSGRAIADRVSSFCTSTRAG